MAYQRGKDRRLYENALQVNENARLSIIKQGDIVNCLSHLSTMLQKSLTKNCSPKFQSKIPNTEEDLSTKAPTQPTSEAHNYDSRNITIQGTESADDIATLSELRKEDHVDCLQSSIQHVEDNNNTKKT